MILTHICIVNNLSNRLKVQRSDNVHLSWYFDDLFFTQIDANLSLASIAMAELGA